MKVLIVCRYKSQYAAHVLPFVGEQTTSLREAGCVVELFLLRGNYWKQWKSLCAKIKEWKPNIIHAHYGLSCLVANLATRRVPVVSTYHGSDINLAKVRPLSKIAMWLSAWNIFVSQRNVDIAKPKKRWSLIPCGVAFSDDQLRSRAEARKVLGWKASDKKILFAGAFDNPVKDSSLAKKAIATLDDVELIELKGYTREQVNTLMCAVNCLLMTSKTEGSPQVIKEAMACGCPVVTTNVGDVSERLKGLDGCYVVERGKCNVESATLLAEALKKAIAFKGKTNGRERIITDGLTNEQVAWRIVKIYEEILNV